MLKIKRTEIVSSGSTSPFVVVGRPAGIDYNASTMANRLQLLGIFHLSRGGSSVTAFRSDKARALLAYVATESGQIHDRATLATLLWPELPDSAAKTNLRNVLSNLRKIAPDFLDIARNTVSWAGDEQTAVDVHNFLSHIDREPAKAVEQYQGEFLGGFSLPDAPLF